MTFLQAIRICYSKYAVLRGRAGRAEMLYFLLYVVLVNLAVVALGALMIDAFGWQQQAMLLFILYSIARIFIFEIPMITAVIRRLHDVGRSARWVAIPLSAAILYFVSYGLGLLPPSAELTPNGMVILTIIAVVLTTLVGVERGDEGENHYGAAPA